MLVCLCKGVSDRRIREEVRRGANTLLQIRQACAAGTDCGTCTKQIRQVMASAGANVHERSGSSPK